MSEGSEAKCICGHPKSEHQLHWVKIGGDYHTDTMQWKSYCEHWEDNKLTSCDCKWYRPVLDWPDAEGWWWCDDMELYSTILSATRVGELIIWDSSGDRYFRDNFGPARFTRLLEQNPFATDEPPA